MSANTNATTSAVISVWELEELKKAAARYEKLRRLNLPQMAELYTQNIKHGKNFDQLVDDLEKLA
ncbi:MAG: hypothetical protein ACD_74C00157G0003 [uncultured bacterium]|jgi:hypothetical protein|nr:MAG: hypothetical protein ACD_74C00157G0003 [uncultured bacterium]